MAFEVDPEELREMARLEEEAGCDVEAGLDWGPLGGAYLAAAENGLGQGLRQDDPQNLDTSAHPTESGER